MTLDFLLDFLHYSLTGT